LVAGFAVILAFAAGATAGDRPVSEVERAKLLAAVQAQGCSGGKLEFDDGAFEVDYAKCADGKTYDLKFDTSMRLIKKEREN
jgi:hypothetical protein